MNYECSICLEDIELKDLEILSCNHKFHKECIETWTKKSPICPYCRKFLKSFFTTRINYFLFKRKCNIFIDEDDFKKVTFVYNYPFSIKPLFIKEIPTSNIKSTEMKKNTIKIIYYEGGKLKYKNFIFNTCELDIFTEKIQSIFTKNYNYFFNNNAFINNNIVNSNNTVNAVNTVNSNNIVNVNTQNDDL